MSTYEQFRLFMALAYGPGPWLSRSRGLGPWRAWCRAHGYELDPVSDEDEQGTHNVSTPGREQDWLAELVDSRSVEREESLGG